jgi:hypothetical protein
MALDVASGKLKLIPHLSNPNPQNSHEVALWETCRLTAVCLNDFHNQGE